MTAAGRLALIALVAALGLFAPVAGAQEPGGSDPSAESSEPPPEGKAEPGDDAPEPGGDSPPETFDDECPPDDDPPCSGDFRTGADEEREAKEKAAQAAPISVSLKTLLRRGSVVIGTVSPTGAGTVRQELVVRGGTAKLATGRRLVTRGGLTKLRLVLSAPGRKRLARAKKSVAATLRTTIVLRSGATSTQSRPVQLVLGKAR